MTASNDNCKEDKLNTGRCACDLDPIVLAIYFVFVSVSLESVVLKVL